MRLKTVSGYSVYHNVSRFRIDWDKSSRSKIQFKIKQLLRPYWERQIVYEEFPVYGSRLKVDIFNATKKIAVEIQGDQHEKFNKFFHGSRLNYFLSYKNDSIKRKWLEDNGYQLGEIYEKECHELDAANIVEFFKNKLEIEI